MKILGECLGIELVKRSDDDEHICIQLLIEDDGNWFNLGNSFSSFWIEDLVDVIKGTSVHLRSMPDDPSGFGKIFGKEKEKKQ
ncbi:hypothetical protein LCGC14_0869470 [marine sediment metagenome]|uniref:Uncharacterized protein n=1 Tax=marine sediment metagenome TaxID=412755 RepID=A0A0F9RPR1_9ZZZZ